MSFAVYKNKTTAYPGVIVANLENKNTSYARWGVPAAAVDASGYIVLGIESGKKSRSHVAWVDATTFAATYTKV